MDVLLIVAAVAGSLMVVVLLVRVHRQLQVETRQLRDDSEAEDDPEENRPS